MASSQETIRWLILGVTEFMGFWRNFVDTFNLQGRKVFFTGESYAGVSTRPRPRWADEIIAPRILLTPFADIYTVLRFGFSRLGGS